MEVYCQKKEEIIMQAQRYYCLFGRLLTSDSLRSPWPVDFVRSEEIILRPNHAIHSPQRLRDNNVFVPAAPDC